MYDIGVRFRIARESTHRKGGAVAGNTPWLTQREVAKLAKMRPAQISRLENGFNMESRHYARLAHIYGFETVTELLSEVQDEQTRALNRIWEKLDEHTRARLLRKLKEWL